MDERAAASTEGVQCRRIMISATVRDITRWDRRKVELRQQGRVAHASRSGAIRVDALFAQRFRHDVSSPTNGLLLTASALRTGNITAAEAADVMERAARHILKLATDL